MTGKALPLGDSDFSILGRQDESDHACVVPTTPPLLALPALPVLPALPAPPPETGPKSDGRLLVLFGIVFVLVAAGAFAYYFLNQDEIDSQIIDSTEFSTTPDERMAKHYGVGALDSDHTHAALAVFVNSDLLDFSHPQFQIQSKYIHLEGANSHLVHKHADGVPLDMLFASLGLRITPACIELEYKDVAAGVNRYCADGGSSSMTFLINGEVLHDIRLYEIKHGDRILISFGDSKLVLEQFEYLERLYIHGVPETIPTLPGDYISV